ncbi:MAG: D-isomer specific 2-hydroxyacid dehydrogenase, binding domain protein [Rhodoferax sp.]|nr:D-isomer specific 2-hydroxyacid dehydrogenase, binding domain protein [Rhodoferax sp.]
MTVTLRPHVLFNSEWDSPLAWKSALALQFDDLGFSTPDDTHSPDAVNIALIWKVPREGLHRFRNLKAILSLGAGVNQLDPAQLPDGVPLARLVDQTLTDTMVEYAKAAVFRCHRNFDVFERHGRLEHWQYVAPRLARDTTVGVLGLGELGSAIATVLRDEGFEVHGWSRSLKPLAGITSHSGSNGLAELARRCAILVNVLPLTPETEGILSRSLFAQCQGTRLINMGRGGHLVEADLLDALASGHVASATLDVTAVEPLPPGHPFWNHPRVLLTPHVAGLSSPATAAQVVATNIRRALAGQPLLHQVSAARGY